VLAGSTLGNHHVALLLLCGRNTLYIRHITFIGVGSINQLHLRLSGEGYHATFSNRKYRMNRDFQLMKSLGRATFQHSKRRVVRTIRS